MRYVKVGCRHCGATIDVTAETCPRCGKSVRDQVVGAEPKASTFDTIDAAVTGMSIVLTLVHGTWARKALWSRPDSAFCKTLRSRLGSLEVVNIEPIDWSGSNSGRARWTGAETLAARVQHCAVTWPDAAHIIIGHSHGGTVILNTLREAALQRAMAGVICLSTPVYHLRPRPRAESREIIELLLSIAITLPVGVLVSTLVYFEDALSQLDWLPLLGLPLFFVWWRLYAKIDAFYQWCFNHISKWKSPSLTVPVLFMRIAGDEASAALAAVRLSAWIAQKAFRYKHWVFAIVMLFGLGSIVPVLLVRLSYRDLLDPYWYSIVFLIVGGLPVLGSMFSVLVLPLTALGFGWDAIGLLLAAEISAEETPPGTWEVQQFSFVDQVSHKSEGFFEHSHLYQYPPAIEAMAQWIKATTIAFVQDERAKQLDSGAVR